MQTDNQIEFEKIKHNVIYMDWNILMYLSDPSILKGDLQSKVMCLSHLFINNINHERTVFPYSNAHLLDIRQGNNTKIKEKLSFLRLVSKMWQISEDPYDKSQLRLTKVVDVEKDYNNYVKHLKSMEASSDSMRPLLERLIEPYITKAKQSMKNIEDIGQLQIVQKLFDSLVSGSDKKLQLEILKFSKRIRNQNFIVKEKRFKFPHAEKDIEKYDAYSIKKKFDEYFIKSDMPYNSCEDFFKIVVKVPMFSSFQQKISELCALSDFVGLTSEKTKKGSSFQSIINDQFHMLYGLRSHLFITEDQNLLIKSRLIKKWINLPVSIMNINQFIECLLKQIILSSGNKKLSGQFVYIFRDENNNEIRRYTVSI